MPVRITDNTAGVKQDGILAANLFLRVMADEVIKISTPKTPKKTGRLRFDILRQVLGLNGKIKWAKHYASIQEQKQFVNYTTPGTGPHFAENAVKEAVRRTRTIAKRAGLL